MYSWLFRRILFPLYETHIAKRKTLNFVKEYQQNQTRPRSSIEAIQLKKLKALLIHAYENCSFYKTNWDQLGFDPFSVTSLQDIEALPVLDKDDIRESYEQFVAKQHEGKNIKKATGGSSGVPFRFELDQESNERRQGVMWRGYGNLGAGLGVKTLYLWGANIVPVGVFPALKDKLYHLFYNRKILNSFEMTKHNLDGYVQQVNRYNADAIVSYVNPLVTLSDYIIENNISINSPKSILTGAEPLYEFQREKIERAFKAPVYNTYGCREFMLIASECKERTGLHINIDHLVVEVLEGENNSGDIVITDLHNFGFPLIRYRNGDRATLSTEQECLCGSSLPKLESIDGRKLDVIRTPDGKNIPGEFFPHLLKDFSCIRQFQVVQNTLDTLDLFLVLFFDNEAELERVELLIQKTVGSAVSLTVNKVPEIALTSSGKLRVTISNLS